MRGRPLLTTTLLLAVALPATAQDRWPSGDLRWPIPLGDQSPASDGSPSDADTGKHVDAKEPLGLSHTGSKNERRFRIELTGRLVSLVAGKFKVGVGESARTIYPRRDLHLPATPSLGYRVLFDVQVTDSVLLGAYATHVAVRGPRRFSHYKPTGTPQQPIPGNTRGRSSLDLFVGEVFLRYVVIDSDRIQFSVGVGVAAMSYRFRFDGPGRRLSARVDTWYAPTINYLIQFRVFGPLYLYLESSSGLLSPLRFFSYHSEFRAGLRYAIGGGLEWILAVSNLSGQVQDLRELYGRRPTGGHRWKLVSYTIPGLETGFALRF